MAKDGVQIPVKVTGDAEAREKLRGVGGEVKNLAGAGESAGRGMQEPGKRSEESGEKVKVFARDAKNALSSVTDVLLPGFGQVFRLITDIVEGAGKLTSRMLGWAAFAAVAAGVIGWLKSITEAAERAAEAAKRVTELTAKRREEAREVRERVAETFNKAGVFLPPGTDAYANVAQRMQQGIPPDVAAFGELADVLSLPSLGRALWPQEIEQIMVAYMATGRKTEFARGPQAREQNRKLLEELLQIGRTEEAQAAFAAEIARTGDATRAAAPTPEEMTRRGFAEQDLIEGFRKRWGLSDEDVSRIRRVLSKKRVGVDELYEVFGDLLSFGERFWQAGDQWQDPKAMALKALRGDVPPGGTQGADVLLKIADVIRAQVESGAYMGATNLPGPVTIYMNAPTTNVGQQYNEGRSPNRPLSPDLAEMAVP
jgi:hypothetical protein